MVPLIKRWLPSKLAARRRRTHQKRRRFVPAGRYGSVRSRHGTGSGFSLRVLSGSHHAPVAFANSRFDTV